VKRGLAFLATVGLSLACSTRGADTRPILGEPQASAAPPVSVPAPAAEDPPPVETTPAAEDAIDAIVATQRELHEFRTTLGDPPDVFQIPAAARPLFPKLERAYLRFLKQELPTALAVSGTDRDASKVLSDALVRRHVVRGFEGQVFGSLLGIEVRRHPGHFVGVVVTSSLDCGSDDTLYVFSTAEPAVRHVMTAAARDRTSIAGGQLGLEYGLLPPPTGGDPEVVVSSTTPWCSSAWRSFRFDVLAAGRAPDAPLRRLTREDSVWIGNRVSEISSGSGWFQIAYDTWSWVGSGVADEKLERFRREGGRWRRVAPSVARADDVVRAWADLPASLAAELVEPGARRSAAALHAQFANGKDRRSGDLAMQQLGPERARVTFDCDGCTAPRDGVAFEVRREAGEWRIAAAQSP
jgi:hypothetical protein